MSKVKARIWRCNTTGCRNVIGEPHEWNDWDLWCAKCHAKARGRDKPETKLQAFYRKRERFLKKSFANRRSR